MKKFITILCLCTLLFLSSCVISSEDREDSYHEGYEKGYNDGYDEGYEHGFNAVETEEDLEAGPYCELCGAPKTNSEGFTDEYGSENYAGDIFYWLCNSCTDNLAESRTPIYVGSEPIYLKRAKVWRDPMGFYLSQPFWFDPVEEIDEYTETDTLAVRFDHVENEDSVLYLRTDWLGANRELSEAFGITEKNRDECDLSLLIEKDTEENLLNLPDEYEVRYYDEIPFVVSYTYDENGEEIVCVYIQTILNGIKISYLYFTNYVASYWQEDTISDLISINTDICFPTGAEANAFFERATDD